jgi:hypothetical protein
VHLVKINMVGLQPAQRRLHRLRDPAARTALLIRIIAHGAVHLGGQHDIVAMALQRLATVSSDSPLLYLSAVSTKVDAEIQGLMDDTNAVIVIGVGNAAEHHRALAVSFVCWCAAKAAFSVR